MKTYEEALDQINVPVQDKSEVEAAVKILVDRVQRQSDLLREIIDNPRTHSLLASIIEVSEAKNGCDVAELAISVFINGIMIGMEMERDDSRRIE